MGDFLPLDGANSKGLAQGNQSRSLHCPSVLSPASLIQGGAFSAAPLEELGALGLPACTWKGGFLLGSFNLEWRQQDG